MSSRRQKLLTRVNWYLQASLKHITEWITGNKFYYRGGHYRQVSLYHIVYTVITNWYRGVFDIWYLLVRFNVHSLHGKINHVMLPKCSTPLCLTSIGCFVSQCYYTLLIWKIKSICCWRYIIKSNTLFASYINTFIFLYVSDYSNWVWQNLHLIYLISYILHFSMSIITNACQI